MRHVALEATVLGYILIACSLALALAAGSGPAQTASYFLEGLTAWSTVQLLGVVTLIELLTVLMQETGSLRRVLLSLRRLFDDSRVLIALVPSILGLLPIPGGAMLSAPMVGSYGSELGMDPDRKSAVNLFFRHICDMVFPFKRQLVLAAAVFNIPLFTLIAWHIPVTVATILAGFWYLVSRRPQGRSVHQTLEIESGQGRALWIEVAPLAIPLLLALAFRIDFLSALAAGLVFALGTQRISRLTLEKMLRRGFQPRLLFILAAVMVFNTVMGHTGLVREMAASLTSHGVPLLVLAVALPMAAGLTTGLDVAIVGMVFPLLVSLVPPGASPMPYILVMMIASGAAEVLSPAHACFVMGNEYYRANAGRVLRMSVPPQLFRLAAGLVFAVAMGAYLS